MNHQESVQIQFQPIGKRISVPVYARLFDAAREAGIDLASACGGEGNCGQCRLVLLEGDVTPPTPDEKFTFIELELLNGSRLACCTRAKSDVKVQIPRDSLITGQRLQIESNLPEVTVDPMIQAYHLALPPSSLADVRADLSRIVDAMDWPPTVRGGFATPAVIRGIPGILRENNWQVTVFARENEIIGASQYGSRPLGFAVDLGTTKIAAYLVDLETGQELASTGIPNPQIGYGEDVISRLNHVHRNVNGGQVLAEKVQAALNELLGELVAKTGTSRDKVVDACIVGNTAMIHLLLQLPVHQLATAPYVPATSSSLPVRASEIGLVMAPGAQVYIPPGIGGFVGADHVAMLVACDLDQRDRVSLGIDIGTNTEIAIRKPGFSLLMSASCASGPALEGAHIHDGMRAASGAIEKVRITAAGVEFTTIDDSPAVGLCGSGIIDTAAELYRSGVINERGRFQRDNHRVGDGRHGPEFLLVPAERSGSQREIAITQLDINEIQLAKGAIHAGLRILLEATRTAPEEVEEVIIAGAFGSFLNVENAIAIGLFPNLPGATYRQVGNAAAIGAKWMLVSSEARQRGQEISDKTQYHELATYPKFRRNFALGMLFPSRTEMLKESTSR